MLTYNWKKIIRIAGRSSNRILLLLDMIVFNRTPRNRWDPIYSFYGKSYSGTSFLINPLELLASPYTSREKAEYVALASLRSYAYYAMSGDASLDLLHTNVSEDIINKNRLLKVENGRVLFKYEEVTKGE